MDLGRMRVLARRVKPDSDLLKDIEVAAEEGGIETAAVMGIGGLKVGRVGVFDGKGYSPIEIRPAKEGGAVEIVSLLGNITLKEGRPFAHLHAVLSNGKEVVGGHLLEGSVVWPTAEVFFLVPEGRISRVLDEELGYYRWGI